MKTLQMLLGVGAMITLLGLNVAMADIRNESAKPLMFSVDAGDGSVNMPELSFDSIGSGNGEEAQTTCAMTPGDNMPNILPEEPVIPTPDPEHLTRYDTPETTPLASSINPFESSSPYNNRQQRPPYLPTDPSGESQTTNPQSPDVVPEPTTLVIVGLGLVGAAAARRRWKNK